MDLEYIIKRGKAAPLHQHHAAKEALQQCLLAALSRQGLLANELVIFPSLALPSLMTGKIHILLTRKDREKGRDWYDYLWYRKNKITPNLPQLQSAIKQTATGPDACYWMSFVRARTHQTNWQNVQSDVSSFLEIKAEAQNLNALKIGQMTPYPNFEEITRELNQLKQKHPLLKNENPVITDIEQAALEGDMAAIEARDAINIVRGIEKNEPKNGLEI